MAANINKILTSFNSLGALSTGFKTSRRKSLLFGRLRVTQNNSSGIRSLPAVYQVNNMASASSAVSDATVSSEHLDSTSWELKDLKEETKGNDFLSPITSVEQKLEIPDVSVANKQKSSAVLNDDTKGMEDGTNNAIKQEDSREKPFVRIRKIKAAILLSYSGQGYFGMQMQNNGTRTIENDLMKGFLDGGVVDEEGFSKPKSIKFQRAARTDKNVSAARNIISLMVPTTFDVDAVNSHLPEQIRVMDFRRVTKGFDAKIACNARTYLYMIPTFAFTPLEMKVQEDYRISSDVLEHLRSVLKLYEGTKNYHNFTSRKKATDPSAMRYIMNFTSSDPFLKDGLEFVVLNVRGQSFMLHQIRKMIGLAVAIMRGCASVETLNKCFSHERLDIPMAPGLGLMLGEAHYDHYNQKFGKDGIHEPLMWDNVAEKIEQFCQDHIYTVVTRTENEEKSMFQWLETVPFHTYDVRDEERRGFGPLGKANLCVKKMRGEDVSQEEEGDSDSEVPKKKRKEEN